MYCRSGQAELTDRQRLKGNRNMNAQQLDHLRKVLRHFGEVELRHYMELGEPAGHISESLEQLQWYLTQERVKQVKASAKAKAKSKANGTIPPAHTFHLVDIAA
jgi:hypothetical protein